MGSLPAQTNLQPAGELTHRIHSLPQELIDLIYDWTFQSETTPTITITTTYKPPHLLRVSRKSRALCAKWYYARTFNVSDANFFDLASLFLKSLPPAHIDHIRAIVAVDPVKVQPSTVDSSKLFRRFPQLPGHFRHTVNLLAQFEDCVEAELSVVEGRMQVCTDSEVGHLCLSGQFEYVDPLFCPNCTAKERLRAEASSTGRDFVVGTA